jgi:GT2 family glycosyltransferase
MPDLTIVIVSWNICADLRECLRSLQETSDGLSLDIWVVDNASSDDTVKMLHSEFPDVNVIANSHNVGFARANNQVLAKCSSDYVLLLNPDTLVLRGTLTSCLEYMRTHPELGILGCSLVYPDGVLQFESARNLPSLSAMALDAMYFHMVFPRSRVFGHTLMSYWDHRDSRSIPCISGAFMLVTGQFLTRVGLMDETYPMYMEDTDWCCRAHEADMEVFYLASASVIHKSGRSVAQLRGGRRRVWLNAKSAELYFRKHMGQTAARMLRLICLWQGVFRTCVSLTLWPIRDWLPGSMQRVATPWLHYALIQWVFRCGIVDEDCR